MKQYIMFKLAEGAEVAYAPSKSPEMWVGNLIHEGINREIIPNIEESFTPVVSEHPIYYALDDMPGAMIVGKLDHLVILPDGDLAVIDVKTVGSMRWLRNSGLGDSLQYVRQLSVYQKAVNVRRGYIWAIAYRDGSLEEELFNCPFEDKNFFFMLSQAKALHSCLVTVYPWECVYPSGKGRCPFVNGNPCPRMIKRVEEPYVDKYGNRATRVRWTTYLPDDGKKKKEVK